MSSHSQWSSEITQILWMLVDNSWCVLRARSLNLTQRVLQQQIKIIGFPLFIKDRGCWLIHCHTVQTVAQKILVQEVRAWEVGGNTLIWTTWDIVNGCDVNVVVNCYLLWAFVLNGLLGGLSDDFGSVSMIQRAISANDLTWDSAILASFFCKWLLSWINIMNWRLLMPTGESKLLDVTTWWTMA